MSLLNLFYFVNFVTQMVVSTVFLYHCYNLQLIIIIIMIIFVLMTYSKLCNNIVINLQSFPNVYITGLSLITCTLILVLS